MVGLRRWPRKTLQTIPLILTRAIEIPAVSKPQNIFKNPRTPKKWLHVHLESIWSYFWGLGALVGHCHRNQHRMGNRTTRISGFCIRLSSISPSTSLLFSWKLPRRNHVDENSGLNYPTFTEVAHRLWKKTAEKTATGWDKNSIETPRTKQTFNQHLTLSYKWMKKCQSWQRAPCT